MKTRRSFKNLERLKIFFENFPMAKGFRKFPRLEIFFYKNSQRLEIVFKSLQRLKIFYKYLLRAISRGGLARRELRSFPGRPVKIIAGGASEMVKNSSSRYISNFFEAKRANFTKFALTGLKIFPTSPLLAIRFPNNSSYV